MSNRKLLFFGSDSCMKCMEMLSRLKKVGYDVWKEDNAYFIDAFDDDNDEICDEFDVDVLPEIVIVEDDKEFWSARGVFDANKVLEALNDNNSSYFDVEKF